MSPCVLRHEGHSISPLQLLVLPMWSDRALPWGATNTPRISAVRKQGRDILLLVRTWLFMDTHLMPGIVRSWEEWGCLLWLSYYSHYFCDVKYIHLAHYANRLYARNTWMIYYICQNVQKCILYPTMQCAGMTWSYKCNISFDLFGDFIWKNIMQKI